MRSSHFVLRAAGVVGGVALLSSMLSGCGTSSLIPGVQIDERANGEVRLNDGRGNAMTAGADIQIPGDFTPDLPRYPGAKTTLAFSDPAGKAASLVQSTSDTVEQAQPRLTSMMESLGFTKGAVMSDAGLVVMSFSKGDDLHVQINLVRKEGSVEIQSVRAGS